MNIQGKKVTLRAMELSDCELVREMFNDPEIESLVVGWALPLSAYAQEQWFRAHYNDGNNLRFVIEAGELGAVGIITLTNIDWKNRCAEHGLKLAAKSNRGMGLGSDALMALMRYAFDELGLHRIDASGFADNTASRTMLKKCGWTEEGLRRKCIYKGGRYHDLITFGVLAEDYRELVERTRYWD